MSVQTTGSRAPIAALSVPPLTVVAVLVAAVIALVAIGAALDRPLEAPGFEALAGGAEPGPFGLEDWHGNVRRSHQ